MSGLQQTLPEQFIYEEKKKGERSEQKSDLCMSDNIIYTPERCMYVKKGLHVCLCPLNSLTSHGEKKSQVSSVKLSAYTSFFFIT